MATVKFKQNPHNLVPIVPVKLKQQPPEPKKITEPLTKKYTQPKKYNPASLLKLKNSLELLHNQIIKKNKILTDFKESEFRKPKRKLASKLAQYRKIIKAINTLITLNHDDCR